MGLVKYYIILILYYCITMFVIHQDDHAVIKTVGAQFVSRTVLIKSHSHI